LERDCQSLFRRLIRKWERLLIMAKRIPALVEPRILEWAQEQLAIPKETAERLGKDADVLEFWEEGRRTRSWGSFASSPRSISALCHIFTCLGRRRKSR
jgi:hypothetical protein